MFKHDVDYFDNMSISIPTYFIHIWFFEISGEYNNLIETPQLIEPQVLV